MLTNSAIWLIVATLIFVSCWKDVVEWWDEAKSGDLSYVILVAINVVVAVLCGLVFYKYISVIRNYDKHPMVVTTEAPKTDTLSLDGKTYYLYEFQDNLGYEIKAK